MANNKQRLALTWIGKGDEPKLEPRILVEDVEISYNGKQTEKMLIHQDNLLAINVLEHKYTGKIKYSRRDGSNCHSNSTSRVWKLFC